MSKDDEESRASRESSLMGSPKIPAMNNFGDEVKKLQKYGGDIRTHDASNELQQSPL